MTDWARKHLLDLASACAEAQAAPELSADQKKALSEACVLVKQFSSLPDGGGGKTVTKAVRRVCETCRNALLHPCAGRADWSVPCLLVQAYVSTDQLRDKPGPSDSVAHPKGTCGPTKAGCTLPLCSICLTTKSTAGR